MIHGSSCPASKELILWCDAEANCGRLFERAAVAELMEKARTAGVTTVVVDVKPLAGEVLYNSAFAPRLGEVDGVEFPRSFDLLAVALEEGHRRGIRIHAGINIFSEGYRRWGRGPAYEHRDWQCMMYEGRRKIVFDGGESVMVDLLDPWESPSHGLALYTQKSGVSLKTVHGRMYAVIEQDSVISVERAAGRTVAIPGEGCVLSLPGEYSVVPGTALRWEVIPIIRSASESAIPSWGIFVNPIGNARSYELEIIREIVQNYDVDGITFDRMRYPNLYADFSDASRAAFEASIDRQVEKWPEEIFVLNDRPWLPPVPGVLYKEWLEWRARQIRDFAESAVGIVRSTNPKVRAGVYVGSWYDSYYDVGVNWGSCSYHPGYEWMTDTYNTTGYAELFDYICAGCYYPIAERADARLLGLPENATVEVGCETASQAVGSATQVFGSVYLRDYDGRPDEFRKALDTCYRCSAGCMLFDLVQLEEYGWWPIVEAVSKRKNSE